MVGDAAAHAENKGEAQRCVIFAYCPWSALVASPELLRADTSLCCRFCGNLPLARAPMACAAAAGESVYTMAGQAKRRKTTEERAAEEAAKLARTASAAADEAWALEARQPWADKQVEAAKPTAEQMEWLEKEGFLKDEETEAAEGEARTLPRSPAHVQDLRRTAACVCAASERVLTRSQLCACVS